MLKKLIILVVLVLVGVPVFAQSVDTAWVKRYKGPGNSDDQAYAIAVDSSGNIYVTGSSGTIKYDADGNQLWLGAWGGVDIAVDGSGNVYVTGESSYDYSTIKYDPNGDTAWVRRYNGSGNYHEGARAIAVDGSGNVYVTGINYGSETYDDYATIKYYSNGDTAWIKRYNGPGNLEDYAYAIALDDSGNVYVTGCSDGGWLNWDYATLKYDPAGNQLWEKRYNGPGNGNDAASAIAVDDSGNVYVTGYSGGSGTYDDYATIKYDPAGNQLWVQRYVRPENGGDGAKAIAVDGSGNVYVTGYSSGPGTSFDYATIKYDPTGNQLWVQRYDGPGNDLDFARAIALDDSGNVYVTGGSVDSGTDCDYATIKYIQFLRGDANSDKKVSVSDVVYIINYLFKGGLAPLPAPIVGDANCDGKVSVSDVVYLINYLFKGGPLPC